MRTVIFQPGEQIALYNGSQCVVIQERIAAINNRSVRIKLHDLYMVVAELEERLLVDLMRAEYYNKHPEKWEQLRRFEDEIVAEDPSL